jgi:hypothetical protein
MPERLRCTNAHPVQPPTRFDLRQLSAGHGDLGGGCSNAVSMAPVCTTSTMVGLLDTLEFETAGYMVTHTATYPSPQSISKGPCSDATPASYQ